MIDLAMNNELGYVSMASIASRQDVSSKYLEQVVSKLTKAGYVASIRGAAGGYRLTKEPAEITVGNILRICDEKTTARQSYSGESGHDTMWIWDSATDAAYAVLDKITLEEIVEKEKRQ